MKTIIIDGIEYNLTPKVLFKKGDFVVIQETTYLISKIEGLNVTLSCNGRDCLFDIDVLKNARLWDITKDAKAGDVIYSKHNTEDFEWIGIFKSLDEGAHFYGFWNNMTKAFKVCNNEIFVLYDDFSPTTKEQREQLEKAMVYAGYIFDFKKKELKKIEKKSSWSEEDETRVESLYGWLDTLINYIHHDSVVSLDLRRERMQQVEQLKTWLKSLKGRVQPQPKQEWNKDDKVMLDDIIDFFENGTVKLQHDLSLYASWLKSLKPQFTWKPSDEQMEVLLSEVTAWSKGCSKQKVLESLYQDLKKLK